MITWFVNLLSKIHIRPKFIEKHKDKIRETDDYIAFFYPRYPKAFVGVLLLYCLLVLVWAAEVHLTMVYMGSRDISFGDSFLITVMGNLAFMFPFVPGMLGVYEATYIALFALLKKDTGVALTLVLIRRIVNLLWAGIGLFGMIKPTRGKPGQK